MSDDADRTFDPTPHRRERFRSEGRYARARDAGGVAATAAVLAALVGSRSVGEAAVRALFARTLGDLGALSGPDGGARALRAAGGALVALAGPAALAAAVAGAVVAVAQAGPRFDLGALALKPERFNPFAKLGQIFSWRTAGAETAVAVVRVAVVGAVVHRALVIELPGLLALARMPLDAGATHLRDAVVRVLLGALGALAVVAAADYAQSWLRLQRELKMTRKELVDESRAEEGDPKVKHRLRARARAAIKRRAVNNVKKADVVVTNPTHVAVALRYGPKDPAPVVVAKGHDALALQIRAEARRHGIPILENRALARALDAAVPLGHPVPAAHFAAVARVLAFVYRLRRPRR